MLLLVALTLTQIAAEWVEISQQHYRKPIRTYSIHNPFTNIDKIEGEDATKSWSYNNRTTPGDIENNDHIRPTNIADTKKAQYAGVAETTADVDENLDKDEFELNINYGPTTVTAVYTDSIKQKGTIERVSNRAYVRRVQPKNNAVKAPTVSIKNIKDVIQNDRYEEFPLDNNDDKQKEYSGVEDSQSKLPDRTIYLNTDTNQHFAVSTLPAIVDEISFEDETRLRKRRPKPEYNNHTIMNNKFFHKPTFVTETEEFPRLDENKNSFAKPTQIKHLFATEVTEIYDTTEKDNDYKIIKQTTKRTHGLHNSKNTEEKEDVPIIQSVNKENDNGVPVSTANLEKVIHDDRKKLDKNSENKQKVTNENKVSNMENLLKILKVAANTISQNTRRSFGGKIRYLHDLKNSILSNIADRIDSTWPDDDTAASRRSSRSTDATSRGHHVHFPSSESALMTISFLTFAVFLIKLVLQLIHTYKNKAMMVAPVMVASAGRTNKHRRN